MYDNINHNKFQSANIIKIEEQSDTTIVIARYVENPLNQKLKIGDFALITYINQRNKNADHFVAYIENVQKPDMKCELRTKIKRSLSHKLFKLSDHDKDDKDFYSTVTFNTPWTNLPIRKLLKIRFQFCVDTDDIQKSLKSIYKLNSDDLLTKFVLNPNNIKQLPSPLNEYTGNVSLKLFKICILLTYLNSRMI